MKFFKFASSLFFIICTNSFGQSLISSQLPLGINLQPSTGSSLLMGGTGIGINDDFRGMLDNPANLGNINRSVFSAVVSLDFLSIDHSQKSSLLSTGYPRVLSLSIPLSNFGTAGISVDSRTTRKTKWRAITTAIPGQIDSMLSSEFDLGVDREGGLVSWQLGWGYSYKKLFSFGLSYEHQYFNDITTKITSISGQIKDEFLDSTKISFTGNGFRVGLQVPFGKSNNGLRYEQVFVTDEKIFDTNSTRGSRFNTFSLTLPPSFGLGTSYQFNDSWLTAADLNFTLWNQFETNMPSYYGNQELRSEISFSAGVQFIPAPNLLVPKFWESLQYRLGLRATQLSIENAYEAGAVVGFGLPLQKGGGLIDFGFEFARRTTNIENYAENVYRFTLGINGGRKWYENKAIGY